MKKTYVYSTLVASVLTRNHNVFIFVTRSLLSKFVRCTVVAHDNEDVNFCYVPAIYGHAYILAELAIT